ncbi:MAG: hypothetical protein DHS20C01_21710 [marine bacterium B5-7]|nr:MAG: hypothetical protein DHS20C01_21710 [marine bacterium B5-7]
MVVKKYGLVPTSRRTDLSLLEAEFERRGWQRTYKPDWDLLWYVAKDPPPAVLYDLKEHQRICHFPGISDYIGKHALDKTLDQPADSNAPRYYPRTWRLADELESFKSYAAQHPDMAWIIKPVLGACGQGIEVVLDPGQVKPKPRTIVQQYLHTPMLHDGCKFNLRLYLLITAIKPGEAYIYNEGYVDLASAPFPQALRNLTDPAAYNTNTHIQTALTDKPATECSVSLSRWAATFKYHHSDFGLLWARIKTMVGDVAGRITSAMENDIGSHLQHRNNCFELLGLDIEIDVHGNPWLIECNRTPEIAALSSKSIKQVLIRDTIDLVCGEGKTNLPGNGLSSGYERLDLMMQPINPG